MAGKPALSREAIKAMAEKAKRGETVSGTDVRESARTRRIREDAAAVEARQVEDRERVGKVYSSHDMNTDVPLPMTKKGDTL